MGSAVFKTNAAVWYGRVLSPTDSVDGAGRERAGRAAADITAASSRRGDEAAGDFSVVDPHELAVWLRRTEGLAWAADERELEVAAACGHRWTSWACGGRTAAFCKVGGGRVFIVDFDAAFELPGRIAYLSDVYVMSQMRRKGTGRALLEETLRFLKDNSFDGIVCHIPRGNAASARLFGSLGFRPLGEVRFTRVLGIRFFSTRPEKLLEKMSLECGAAESCRGGRRPA